MAEKSFISSAGRFLRSHKLTLPLHNAALRVMLFGHYISDGRSGQTLKRMAEEKSFFSSHRDELQKVYDMLEDERSKETFENVIRFRITHKLGFLKKCTDGLKSIDSQYFVPEIKLSDKDVIVDCGAYTGDSAVKFFPFSPRRIVSLEPDEENFRILSALSSPVEFKAYKCGAWSEDTVLRFSGGKSDSSLISDSGEIEIQVRALDNIPECQDASYIKMDIEGAELQALKGAEHIIKSGRPKLAVCLYHKPEDFFQIPLYIKSLNPDYKLYVYHHHPHDHLETVLYAV